MMLMHSLIFLTFIIFLGGYKVVHTEDIYACDNEIYCKGDILDYIQKARIFPDGKTFVDMSLKSSPATVLSAFQTLLASTSSHPSKSQLRSFTNQYFDGPGTEFEPWTPEDYIRLPSFMEKIRDPLLRDFGWNLCRTWKDLGRKIKVDVRDRPDRYSLLYLPKPFIVPGGRFRETYYWDSYWVIKGLLICEMNTTVKDMLENFAFLVDKLGFIPNGGRVYYTGRSQPPFFIPMVNEYYKATNDLEFIRNISSSMENEYLFWQVNRTINVTKDGETFQMNRYSSSVNTPRPESYVEDLETAKNLPAEDKRELYSHLASACESGWDFSSRWLSREDKSLSLNTTITRDIVPVDLNSILYLNEKILSQFFRLLGDDSKSVLYANYAKERKRAIEKILWNEDRGIWQDYSVATNSSRDYFFPSNLFPLFVEVVDDKTAKIAKVLEYLEYFDILNYEGGIPTSLLASNQQWDFPNGWPNLQQTFIWALENSENSEARNIAFNISQTWIDSNWKGWNRTRNMFEKYSVVEPGSRGGGGEYGVQEGFGWTNGVILDILNRYGDRLTSILQYPTVPLCTSGISKTGANSCSISFLIFIYIYLT